MLKMIWNMPDSKDEEFTKALLERIEKSAQSFGIEIISVEIKEQYSNEDTPHYHFKIAFGKSYFDSLLAEVSADYSAVAEGEKYDGSMKIIIETNDSKEMSQLMAIGAFYLYDEYIREYYPEWETIYNKIN